MSFKIKKVKARQIIDGRGFPTIEVDVITEDKVLGRAVVPSGSSVGKYEAMEIRDNERAFKGKGVLKAVENVNKIIGKRIVGMDIREQENIDKVMIELDGTKNKSRLGANAILAVSLAVAKAASSSLDIPLYKYVACMLRRIEFKLPYIMLNILPGGKHNLGQDSFEDRMIVPIRNIKFSESLRASLEVYYELGDILMKEYGRNAVVGGNYTPPVRSEEEAFNLMEKALRRAGYEDVFGFAIDVAATQLYNKRKAKYTIIDREFVQEELFKYYIKLTSKYPIVAIEDPFHEDDFDSFAKLLNELNIMIIGDDLFCTNIDRLRIGVKYKAANALLFKINQVGTLSEALRTAEYAIRNNYTIIASMRSKETEDTMLADIAVGVGAKYIKGSVIGGERVSKYNRLLRIEEELS